jgi:hypothetical protein
MKKLFFVILIFFGCYFTPFAEDVYFKTIKKVPVRRGGEDHSSYWQNPRILFELPEGTIVQGYSGVLFQGGRDQDHTPFQKFIWENDVYATYIESLIPAETKDLFAQELVSDISSLFWDTKYVKRRHLTSSYYVEALSLRDRNLLLNKNPSRWQWFIEQANENAEINYDQRKEWWEYVLFDFQENLLIFQTALLIRHDPYYSNLVFLIKNISKNGNVYHVTVKSHEFMPTFYGMANNDPSDPIWNNTPVAKLPSSSRKNFFDFILVHDGDYLDLYVDNYETHFATFVYVDSQFIKALDTLIKTGTFNDLTNVSLPKRADGSMDYQLPVVSTDTVIKAEETENSVIKEESAEANTLPIWALAVIAGGVIVVAGGVVLIIKKSRK